MGAPDVRVDVAVFGGGIAGLWILDAVRRAGLSAVLFERDRLGAGQSVASQGIVHGGTKYTLGLSFDRTVATLRAMPDTWRDALRGVRGPDLTKARVLADHTAMWIPEQAGGGLLGAFSRLLMQSRVRALERDAWPAVLRDGDASGRVYALDEPVVDVPSVLEALRAAHAGRVLGLPSGAAVAFDPASGRLSIGDLRIAAGRVVLAAGAGNEALMRAAGWPAVPHRRRPLGQLIVAGMRAPLYAHCVGPSARPLFTVTAHPTGPGEWAWSVGGGIAERAVGRTPEQTIAEARETLPRRFPGADFGAARFATWPVDRAEGVAPGRRRVGGPVVAEHGDALVVWPAKLAAAPALAAGVVDRLAARGVAPGPDDVAALADWPRPAVAPPPWEAIDSWR